MTKASVTPGCQFASDNTAGVCPEAWAALERANAGCVASYGDDPWTARACGWRFYDFIGSGGFRFMCSWATTEADVDALLADAMALLPGFSNGATPGPKPA